MNTFVRVALQTMLVVASMSTAASMGDNELTRLVDLKPSFDKCKQEPTEEQQTGDVSMQFGLEWYRLVAQESAQNENLVLSPTSMQAVLGMLYLAASESSPASDDLRDRVFNGMDKTQVAAYLHKLAVGVTNEDQNGMIIYLKPDVKQEQARFLVNMLVTDQALNHTTEKFNTLRYCADMRTIVSEQIRVGMKTANKAINLITKGEIPNMIDESLMPPDLRVLFLNVLYFNATWLQPFTNGIVYDNNFKLYDKVDGEKKVQTKFMEMDGLFPYLEKDNIKMIALDYTDRNQTMYLIMPTDESPLKMLEETLTADTVNGWRQEMKERETIVTLPKFALDTNIDASQSIQKLGLDKMFERIDMDIFSKSYVSNKPAPSKVNLLVQRVVLNVHESGTTGSSITSLGMTGISAKATFKANRSFVFYVYDKPTQSMLFVGRFVNPRKE